MEFRIKLYLVTTLVWLCAAAISAYVGKFLLALVCLVCAVCWGAISAINIADEIDNGRYK